MSSQLALFDVMPVGAIEILPDADSQPWIRSAQYGKCLGLLQIYKSILDEMKCEQHSRSEVDEGQKPILSLGRSNNLHKIFISVGLAL